MKTFDNLYILQPQNAYKSDIPIPFIERFNTFIWNISL